MGHDRERSKTEPSSGEEKSEVQRCLVRLNSEGKSLEEIAAGLRAETGLELSPADVERLLREIAAPVPSEPGADPKFFSGHLGGG